MSDLEQLAVRASGGDARALDDLLSGSQALAMTTCRRFLPNELDAEEAAQDALLAVATRIGGFEGRSKYTTWLYQVATNASIDRYRKLKRRRSDLVEPPPTAAAGSTPSVRAGTRIAILDAAEQLERRVVVPVLLRDLMELDYRDIAQVLEIPEGTARYQVSEGRRKLRELLSPLQD